METRGGTRGWQHNATCEHCGGEVAVVTPFSLWLRGLPHPYTSATFDNQNLDYIWHNYRDGWFITIEEKRYGGHSTAAQRDTHGVIAQMLARASGAVVQTMRGKQAKEYRGHYLVVFENTTPDDSGWISINGRDANRDVLLFLLLTGELRFTD